MIRLVLRYHDVDDHNFFQTLRRLKQLKLEAVDRPSSACSTWFSVSWSSELPINCVSHMRPIHGQLS